MSTNNNTNKIAEKLEAVPPDCRPVPPDGYDTSGGSAGALSSESPRAGSGGTPQPAPSTEDRFNTPTKGELPCQSQTVNQMDTTTDAVATGTAPRMQPDPIGKTANQMHASTTPATEAGQLIGTTQVSERPAMTMGEPNSTDDHPGETRRSRQEPTAETRADENVISHAKWWDEYRSKEEARGRRIFCTNDIAMSREAYVAGATKARAELLSKVAGVRAELQKMYDDAAERKKKRPREDAFEYLDGREIALDHAMSALASAFPSDPGGAKP